jgi:hypothetical protein
MSWQSYVDDHLLGTGHVSQAAICGNDGALWAASEGFDVRHVKHPSQLEDLAKFFFVFSFSKVGAPMPYISCVDGGCDQSQLDGPGGRRRKLW